ncbi:HNH endonuclease signature motif containing protein [Undibacterium cyanobacteriorum]|uniref:HNH endonuclease signature motif containing protein n=1 Tax=Undibacterium cyanobacteriorum TaxID=3073561 RepID=A0ABY9RFX8_9BURK|nr:HNH endonuclease signature motif containing protein [Undibacterium sp. 20NA77.5]WMW80117.1 HNH endonuclease signature motif containing protein [Undibacterium sp. 20NA77.5]
MLNSLEVESALRAEGFTLEINNAHAGGYKNAEGILVFVKRSKEFKANPRIPMFKQPLVVHWSIKETPAFAQLQEIASSINPLYVNHNMRGFEEPYSDRKQNGIAINVESIDHLKEIIKILSAKQYIPSSSYEDITLASSSLDGVPETTRKSIVDARLGQGVFRENLIKYWESCAVTDCTVHKLLRASHIKPWRVADNSERLDKFNGLLLSPNLDLAFDQDLISFDDKGNILIKSDILDRESLLKLGISENMKLRRCEAQHKIYLSEHRRIHQF